MLGVRLMRLIERHSDELASGLSEKLLATERTCDFRKIQCDGLELAAADIYHNLGDWLLGKTETDIEKRFQTIAAHRFEQGISLPQFVWALIMSRDHLLRFLRTQAFPDNVVALYGEMELQQILDQFFDRALYYGVLGYVKAEDRASQRDLHPASRG